jgi:hypothetical protein
MGKGYIVVGSHKVTSASVQLGCNLTVEESETNPEAPNKKNQRYTKGRSFKMA